MIFFGMLDYCSLIIEPYKDMYWLLKSVIVNCHLGSFIKLLKVGSKSFKKFNVGLWSKKRGCLVRDSLFWIGSVRDYV